MVKTLADRLAEVKAKTVRDTVGHVENYSLVNKFAATLAEMKAKTIDATLHYFQSEALTDMRAETLQEVSASIFPHIELWCREVEVEAEVLLNVHLEPMKIDDTLADVEGIAYTIRWLKADTVVDTLGDV